MTQAPLPVPPATPFVPGLSQAARHVHQVTFAQQWSALALSAAAELSDPRAFQGAIQKVAELSMRAAVWYDQHIRQTAALAPAPPPPVKPPSGVNADGTPFVWDRPPPALVTALSLLRSLAEEPPTTLEETAKRIAPIQQFLKAYDDAQPRI